VNIGIDDVNCKYAFSCVMCCSLLLRELFAVVHFVRDYELLDCRTLSQFVFCLLLSCELFEVVYFECDYQFWKCLRNSANLAQTGHGMVSVRIWRLVLDFKIT
jgi:hypothetical protein